MKNTFIHNKSVALFMTFFISAIALNYWLSANAQNTSSTSKAPTYTSSQDAKNFQIKGKGKAFLPKNLQQTNKPEQADDPEFRRRGVIGWDDRIPMLSHQVNDWAVLKLNKPIGLKYGYIGWKSLPSSALIANSNKYIFVGYSGDFPDTNNQKYQFFTAGKGWTASVEDGCSIVKEENNVLLHDCDTAGGSSGGAIIGVVGNQPYILALNNAEYKRGGEAIINLGVKIDFLDRLMAN